MASLADLRQRIDLVRQKERKVVFMTGWSRVIVTMIIAVTAYLLIDWIFDLPYLVRVACALTTLGIIAYIFYKYVVRELRKIADDDEIALRVESRNPDLRGRLISTLQLSRASQGGEFVGSPEMLRALEVETIRMSEPLDFFRIINVEMLKKFGLAATIVIVIKLVLCLRFPGYYKALGERLVKPDAQFPTSTKILEVRVPPLVPRGDDLTIKVLVDKTGLVPEESGSLSFNGVSGSRVSVELKPDAEPALFTGTLNKALEDMSLRVWIGDAHSNPIQIHVIARPEVDANASTIQYRFPPYTNLADPPADKFGGLTILTGSTADITLTATKPLTEAKLERSDGTVFPCEKTDAQSKQWILRKFPVDRSGSFHITLVDTDGLRNAQPAVEYPIDARPDHPPSVKILKPARDITRTPMGKVEVSFSARDDYAIRCAWLCFRVQFEGQTNPSTEITRVDLPNVPHVKDILDGKVTWDLSSLNAKPGDQIFYWLEADDDCPNKERIAARRRTVEDPEAPKVDDKQPKILYSRSAELKVGIVSRDEKIAEVMAEIQRLTQQVQAHKDANEDLKRKLSELYEMYQKLQQQ